ncbi:hypothetical protein FSARC_3450 [Fusarium sarcochroum]|uniref:Uncharacterized protein n=1 Tax=Fusarium sarcochroum TaxID=1208366 RepID=A0A8H4U4F4_9HYPO|nr:hypothetical protein FSARC_3450 [Fusarium sarcochroum]
MESRDIRECYDFEDADAEIVAAILDTNLPNYEGGSQCSGLDCLTVVVRRIYSHTMLGPGVSEALGWTINSEEKNPILRHAWDIFGNEDQDKKETREAQQKLSSKLQAMGYSTSASFEDLCNSPLMKETFWCQDVFRLHDILLCPRTAAAINESPDEIARTSLLELDHVANPDLALKAVIDKSFGLIVRNGKEVNSRPSRPWIIRLVYQPHPEPQKRLDINGLRCLSLPFWEDDKNEPTVTYRETGRSRYCLLAVVRLRDTSVANDYVRTYSCNGANIIAEYEPPEFTSCGWSLKDSPGKYMLFYGLLPDDIEDPRRFPEVAPPQRLNESMVERIGKHQSFLMDKIKKAQQAKQVPSLESRQRAWRKVYVEEPPVEPACGPFEIVFPSTAKFDILFLGENGNFLARVRKEFLQRDFEISWFTGDNDTRVIIVGFSDNVGDEDGENLFVLLMLWRKVWDWVKRITDGEDIPLITYLDAKRSVQVSSARVVTGSHAYVVGSSL